MEDLLDYFRRTDDDAPIQYDCQQSFVIVVTDGLPTMDRDVSAYLWDADGDGNDPGTAPASAPPTTKTNMCSDHVDDVAYWARHHDLVDWLGEPDEPWEDGQTAGHLHHRLRRGPPAAGGDGANGDGLYLPVSDAAELWASLETIMVNIRQRVAAGAAVAVVSSESADTDYLFRGKYKPDPVDGLRRVLRPALRGQGAARVGGRRPAGGPRRRSSRTIYTFADGLRPPSPTANADRLVDELGVADAAEAAALVAWTRGEERPRVPPPRPGLEAGGRGPLGAGGGGLARLLHRGHVLPGLHGRRRDPREDALRGGQRRHAPRLPRRRRPARPGPSSPPTPCPCWRRSPTPTTATASRWT